MNNRDMPASPSLETSFVGRRDDITYYESSGGLTKLEYAAIHILPCVYADLVRQAEFKGWPENWREGIANDATKIAKTLFDELEKSK